MEPTILAQISTPIPVVDLDRLESNVARTAAYAAQHGLALRPHVKTHKSAYVAALQMASGAHGVTCATPREAEVMRAASSDILLAYPTIGSARVERIARLAVDARISVMVDSAIAIDAMGAALAPFGARAGVLIEIDVGMRRTGVHDPHEAVSLARWVLDTPGLDYVGIGFYPGHIREPMGEQDAAIAALRSRVTETVAALHAAGLPPSVISGGSTPTLWRSHEVGGLTEIRPGTSVYNDRTTAAIGACAADDCALTVLATVVSTSAAGRVVVDAGTKSLGREPIRGVAGEGYGMVLGHPEALVVAMSEEHGMIDVEGTDFRPRVGEVVRIVPNHVCIVTHLFDAAWGIRGNVVERQWPIGARGR